MNTKKSKIVKSLTLVYIFSVIGVLVTYFLIAPLQSASAEDNFDDDQVEALAWQPKAIKHAKKMKKYKDVDKDEQATPSAIPKLALTHNSTGILASYQPRGLTKTQSHPFFQNLGSNNRTCFTCHQPQSGWGVSAADVKKRFVTSNGKDPIFRLVDGATCPKDNVSTKKDKKLAYKLLITKGLFRIGLPLPSSSIIQFEVTDVNDPYNCTTNLDTGLTSTTNGIISIYRRPLPSTNLGFNSTIMWDGREPSLHSQAADATLGHAQALVPLTEQQIEQIVAFESGLFTAQDFDQHAKSLKEDNATGGVLQLSTELVNFYIGVNDPSGKDPKGIPFSPIVFNLYMPWQNIGQQGSTTVQRNSIARGQNLFNNKVFTINSSITGSCSNCHNTPNIGNHSSNTLFNIGIANAGESAPPAVDISDLPVFTLTCTKGPLTGSVFTVTDPGRALITGQCKDIGKFKVPALRGLAGRAPYFHNGSAKTLMDVVSFYNQRFIIGFTDEEKQDLVNFLNAL